MNRSMQSGGRAGFTLVELLVVAVIGVIVLAGVLQILVSTQRVYTTQSARIQSQQTVRAGLQVLSGELREVSPAGGDLLILSPHLVTLRAMRTVGLACAVTYGAVPRITAVPVGGWFRGGDSVFVMAENLPTRIDDDRWIRGRIGGVDTTVVCDGGAQAQDITLPDLGAAMAIDSVRPGALVRAFEHVSYGIYDRGDGDWYLGQRRSGAGWEPLVGPLLAPVSTSPLFRYLDAGGGVTAVPGQVRLIEVSLRSQTGARGQGNTAVQDSLTTRIHLRN